MALQGDGTRPLETSLSLDDKKGITPSLEAVGPEVPAAEKEVIQDTIEAAHEYTPAQFKRVLRKQDFILLPLMWLCVSFLSPSLPRRLLMCDLAY
jgi:hypothetical protein